MVVVFMSVWNVTVFLESALGVDASLLSNVSLTATGTAGTVRVAVCDCCACFCAVCCMTLLVVLELQVR